MVWSLHVLNRAAMRMRVKLALVGCVTIGNSVINNMSHGLMTSHLASYRYLT